MRKWKKGFNKERFFYGHKGEVLFQQLVPQSKRQSKKADFRYNDCQVEIGRSKFLNTFVRVYFRKIFYNISPDYHYLKQKNPNDVLDFVCKCTHDNVFLVPFDKFIFIYFTNSLKKCAIFTYYDLIASRLLKNHKTGEYSFKVDVPGLYDVKEIPGILEEFNCGCSQKEIMTSIEELVPVDGTP